MDSKLCAHGTKGVSSGVNTGLQPLKLISIIDSYHPFCFWPCRLASILIRFSSYSGGKNLGFFFPSGGCNLTIGWEWLTSDFHSYSEYFHVQRKQMLFPVIEKFKSECLHVCLGVFACGCQLQISPSPSSIVKFFLPHALCSGFHELGN